MGCRTWPWLQLSPGWHCQGSTIRGPSLHDDMESQNQGSILESPLGSCPLAPWGLFALNNRSIFRAFNFLVVPEPAVTKREESTIRLCCLGGFHGHHRPLGLNSPLSSLAPWCEMLKTLMESFQASLPIRSTIRFLSEPPVIVKRKPGFVCIYWRQDIYFGWMESLVRWVMKITWRSACCRFLPCGIRDTIYYSIYHPTG